jgi:sulfonate dioxygenase
MISVVRPLMHHQHINHSADIQVRVKWDNRTVSIWDNRVTAHTAISDYDVNNPEEGLRHGFRITTLGEKPVSVQEAGVAL